MIQLLTLLVLVTTSALAADLTGPAKVTDGDTIVINEQRIRLHGIDAPEMKQKCMTKYGDQFLCGEDAKVYLVKLIGDKPVRCEGDKKDRYKRLIGTCYVGQLNLNAEMVSAGWALAYTKYSKDYMPQEARAMSDHRGMWNGEFVAPWQWRKSRRGKN